MSFRAFLKLLLAAVCLTVSLADPAAAQLVASGKTLTATTPNAVATFNGPDLIGFQNVFTGEAYLKKPSAGELAVVDTINFTGQALQPSNWTIGTESGTGLPLATITTHDSIRTLTMTVKIDPASQEIVLHTSAVVTTPGVRNAGWTIAGLDVSNGKWIVPAYTGIAFDKSHPGLGAFVDYPNTWHAQMAVYETSLGSFVLYSTDQQFYSKNLWHSTRGDGTLDVGVRTQAVAPFPSATTVPDVEWRLKAFAADWRVAAKTYRDWLNATRPSVSNAAHPWVSNIRAVVGVNNLDTSLLAPLAAALVPSQTLLYLIDWRQTSYDVNYPDYTPRAGVASYVSAAHALGFKVMLHTDLVGASPGNPDFASLQPFQVRGPENLEPWGWQWDQPSSTPTRFAFINPASSTYRSLFLTRVGAAIAAVSPDALHLDVSGPGYNDGNGLIEGRNFSQGSAKLHQDLIAAFPSIALAGEGENDNLYRYHSFAQAWFYDIGDDTPGHPIATFLFSPQVQYYGHLGQPGPIDPDFAQYLLKIQRRAILPRLQLSSSSDLDTTDVRNARLIGILQSWQTHAFQPAWTADWTGAVVKYEGLAGSTASMTDTPTLMTLTGAGSTLFQLAHDANQITTSSFIRAWPAFDSTHLYGLDPSKLYFLDSLPRPVTTHVTSLPQGVRLGEGTLIGSSFAHVEVLPVGGSSFDFAAHVMDAHTGVRFQGVDTPLGNGGIVLPTSIAVGGVRRSGLSIQPPFLAQVGGETFAEYLVPVPANATLRFSVGIDDGAQCTDGVTFRVTANGFELWQRNVNRGAWQDVVLNLAPYAGSTIALRVISNPGPASNPSCDWALWSGLSLGAVGSIAPVSVPLSLASGSVLSGFDGDGVLSPAPPLSATVNNVPVPGGFTVFTQAGAAVSNGTNLTSLPFNVWAGVHGELAGPGSVFTSGAVGPATSGGVTKNPTIFAHPPNTGATVLSWMLALPNATPLRLTPSVGLADGAVSTDGVDFQIRVNGVTYWHLSTQTDQWLPGALDLSRWKGQNILLELVTDSGPTFFFDWAYWADLALSSSPTMCSYALPSSASITASGGAFSANVTATTTCPWSAVSDVPWLTVTSGSGNGNGTLGYSVAPNAGPARAGNLKVADQTLVVNQAASTTVTNQPPSVSSIANVGARRNVPAVVHVTVGDPVGGAAGVVLSAISSNGALVPNGNIIAGGSGADRTLTVVPAPNQIGMTIITVTASARGFSATTTFRLTVHGMGPAADFDGDLRADIGVYRPSAGTWYMLHSSSGFTAGAGYPWGASTDLPQLGDYDGDGKTDVTVYRPANGLWFVLKSTTNYTAWDTFQWGTAGDMPVPADYDGDGRTDVAVYRPSTGTWYILLSSAGFATGAGYVWGAAGDVPLPGDYDGDGKADLAVYRPSSGHWFILKSRANYAAWDTYQWGSTGDVQVPADYDGDGRTDIAVYRPSNGSWYILLSSSGFAVGAGYAWGIPGDVPVPEDFDGDGQTDIAVYRASTANWFILTSRSQYLSWLTYQWGSTGDIPILRRP